MTIIRNVPRARDEEILFWLRAKASGATWTAIAERAGKKWVTVQNTCRNVREADLSESGETRAAVLAGYW